MWHPENFCIMENGLLFDYFASESLFVIVTVFVAFFVDLTIVSAFPCRCRLADSKKAPMIEEEVRFVHYSGFTQKCFWTFIHVIQNYWIYILKNCLLLISVYIWTAQIRQAISASGLILVGWYHSHPFSQASPSVKDIDCQMSYQLCMKGSGSNYFPCVGVIIGEQWLQNIYQIFILRLIIV